MICLEIHKEATTIEDTQENFALERYILIYKTVKSM